VPEFHESFEGSTSSNRVFRFKFRRILKQMPGLRRKTCQLLQCKTCPGIDFTPDVTILCLYTRVLRCFLEQGTEDWGYQSFRTSAYQVSTPVGTPTHMNRLRYLELGCSILLLDTFFPLFNFLRTSCLERPALPSTPIGHDLVSTFWALSFLCSGSYGALVRKISM
jgi:hypothetical protein